MLVKLLKLLSEEVGLLSLKVKEVLVVGMLVVIMYKLGFQLNNGYHLVLEAQL